MHVKKNLKIHLQKSVSIDYTNETNKNVLKTAKCVARYKTREHLGLVNGQHIKRKIKKQQFSVPKFENFRCMCIND